ncbi:MAG: DHA2 family efflux MFS transporter permease subunit [Burkholderiales bacterium]|nr:DHA2 family efflux MFS transporter permease subunit [Burkholderiales bacterium]
MRPAATTEELFARYGPGYRWLATATVMLGTISAVLTTTSVNVAIPDIMGAFGIGQDRAQWLSTGTLAAMTVGMLLNAWLMDNFGQRNVFIGALAVFIAALLLAGLAPNENVLIFSRIVQGAIAGVLQPLAMYTLFRVFPPNRRGAAMGLFGMSVILGPAIGPTLGGVLIDLFNWRFIFFAPMAVSMLAIIIGSLFLPGREESSARVRFDWPGFVLLSVAIATVLTALSNGQREGWHSDYVLSLLAIAASAGGAFIAWSLRIDAPLVDLRVFANPRFAAASAVGAIYGAGIFGSTYLVPLFVQTIQHATPLAAGLLLMPAGLVMGALMPVGGYMSDRISPTVLVVTGLLFFAVSAFWLAGVDTNMPFWTVAFAVVLSRIGISLIKPALNLTAMRALTPVQLSQGAGMINFVRQLGGAFGVNLLSVLLDRRTFFHSDALTAMQTAANSTTMELLRTMEALLARAGVPEDLQGPGALHFLGKVIHAQAYTMGFRDSFLAVAIVYVLAIIPAWIMARTGTRTETASARG